MPAVVVPVSPRGSGDGRVRLIAAHPESSYIHRLAGSGSPRHPQAAPAADGMRLAPDAGAAGNAPDTDAGDQPDILPAEDPLAREAFTTSRALATPPPPIRGTATRCHNVPG